MTHGIKISKEGKEVATSGPVDLSMTSEKKSLKISLEGEWTKAVASGGSTYSVTIAHNLGYIPCYRVYSETDPSSGKYFQTPVYPGLDEYSIYTYVDDSNLYIEIYSTLITNNGTLHGKYFIFEDEQ
jgi:hypothetical protein